MGRTAAVGFRISSARSRRASASCCCSRARICAPPIPPPVCAIRVRGGGRWSISSGSCSVLSIHFFSETFRGPPHRPPSSGPTSINQQTGPRGWILRIGGGRGSTVKREARRRSASRARSAPSWSCRCSAPRPPGGARGGGSSRERGRWRSLRLSPPAGSMSVQKVTLDTRPPPRTRGFVSSQTIDCRRTRRRRCLAAESATSASTAACRRPGPRGPPPRPRTTPPLSPKPTA